MTRGCPLSPVSGAFFLYGLDQQFASSDVFYIRYMDDILILTETRWKLRRAVRQLNQALAGLRLEKSRPKTFIGKAEKGFDFLGYRFEPGGLSLARKTVENFVSRAARLYERKSAGGSIRQAALEEPRRALRRYVKRWLRWTQAGLSTSLYADCGTVPKPQIHIERLRKPVETRVYSRMLSRTGTRDAVVGTHSG